MSLVKTRDEIALIQEGAEILSQVHGQIAQMLKPGVKTLVLDKLAETVIRDHGGIPAFKGYNQFPATLCTSVNEYIVHGVPNDTVLRAGDIVSVDCGVLYKGFYSDAAFTYPVGEVHESVMKLLKVTKEALNSGINVAKAGNRIGDIGHAIQHYVQQHGYAVVRELVGHGVGRALHENPQVPNYGQRGRGVRLKPGMVLAIEPMVNLGKQQIVQERNGAFRTLDGNPSAHFEHTVVVMADKALPLTTYKYIEAFFDF